MRVLASILTIALLVGLTGPVEAQISPRHFDVEVEPLSYTFGGAGSHLALQRGAWKYEVEVFGLEIPESLHGNDGFEASPLGIELHLEHFFGDNASGFYVGPEVGLVQLELLHRPSGMTEHRTRYSIGMRGGYQWYTGLGNLYLSPVVGISYTLNGDAVTIAGDTYETSSLGPWGTVGLGWSFGR